MSDTRMAAALAISPQLAAVFATEPDAGELIVVGPGPETVDVRDVRPSDAGKSKKMRVNNKGSEKKPPVIAFDEEAARYFRGLTRDWLTAQKAVVNLPADASHDKRSKATDARNAAGYVLSWMVTREFFPKEWEAVCGEPS